jgi:4-hydroxy-3-polyprenylbenzoate decarboxylase
MKIVVAITGSSGVLYGRRAVEELRKKHDVYVIITDAAKKVAEYEKTALPKSSKNVRVYSEKEMDAPTASGSFGADGMLVIPCSTKTLAAIAHGYSDNLVRRSADVMLKERKKLILVLRETPLSTIHIRNMLALSEAGATILPASPAFYNNPKSINDMVDFVVGKALDQLGVRHSIYARWKEKE